MTKEEQFIVDIKKKFASLKGDKLLVFNELIKALSLDLPVKDHPICSVRWVPVDQVIANDYNPNSVAMVEMDLLAHSILKDGYTQPVVTVWNEEKKCYVIVDGFHRTTVMKTNKDVKASTGGYLPIVVLDKHINDRMASTVRHNRARGTHSIDGMSKIVFDMLDQGWEDEQICNEMGMEASELIRLKHITGFSKLFADTEYNKEWKTRKQLLLAKDYYAKNKENNATGV